MSHEDTDDEDFDDESEECEHDEEEVDEPARCRVGLADGLFWTACLRDFDGWGDRYFDASEQPRELLAATLPHLFAMLGFASSRGIMGRA